MKHRIIVLELLDEKYNPNSPMRYGITDLTVEEAIVAMAKSTIPRSFQFQVTFPDEPLIYSINIIAAEHNIALPSKIADEVINRIKSQFSN